MAGTTTERVALFLVPTGAIDRVTEERLSTTARVMSLDVEHALSVYGRRDRRQPPGTFSAR